VKAPVAGIDRLPGSRSGSPARRRSRVVARLKAPVRRWLLKSGAMQWGTKSFEFWTLLMIVLGAVRPRRIVELGAGRSTSYLADYAMKTGARYAAIEQSRIYARRLRRALTGGFVDARVVHHVPLSGDGWYEAERLAAVVDFEPDMLFIDGPVGAQEDVGHGTRCSRRGVEWQQEAARAARILIVDDVHRRSNLAMYESLIAGLPRHRSLYLAYEPRPGCRNVAAVAVPADLAGPIERACGELRIPLLPHHTLEDCSEA